MNRPAWCRVKAWHNTVRLRFTRTFLSALALASFATTSHALPPGFSFENIATNLNQGVAFDFAPGNLVYVAEKGGRVRVIQNGNLIGTPFIDISERVNSSRDRGLLGIAVDPDFPSQPWIYLLFTYDPPELAALGLTGRAAPDGAGNRVSRLIRVRANAANGYRTADLSSEELLLGTNSTYENIGEPGGGRLATTPSCNDWGRNQPSGAPVTDCIPIDEESHTIGTLRFLPDRSLLVSSGDGGSYGGVSEFVLRAQNLDSLGGKILRIDPDTGLGLPDNPYVVGGNTTSNRSRVHSYGLRNPFRFTLHYNTNEPVIGDVGWRTWEEVNYGSAKNFGWPCYEGANGTNAVLSDYQNFNVCQALYANASSVTAPEYAYNHNGQGASIQVGDYSIGNNYPAEYDGALFISDFNRGVVETLTTNAAGNVTASPFEDSRSGYTHILRAPNNNLWFLNIIFGTLQELQYTANNQAPTADFSINGPSGPGLLSVSVDASASDDPDGDALTYAWNFGDGTTGTGMTTSHTYSTAGSKTITLVITDPSGASDTLTKTITVGTTANTAPVASITLPSASTLYAAGSTVSYAGTGTDAEDGTLTGGQLTWSAVLFHNTHNHPDYFAATGASGTFTYDDHGDNTFVRLCLTVTDSNGASDEACRDLQPREVTYTLDSNLTAVPLSFSGVTGAAPFSITTIVGGERTISAPATSVFGNSFTSWSDGGTRIHNITIGSTDQTVIATYSSTNRSPKVFWPGNPTTEVGQGVSIPVVGSDPDNDPLTFSATGLPTGTQINQSSGLISGTPTVEGNYAVLITVTDPQGATDSTSIFWRVTDSGGNNTNPKVFWPGDRREATGGSVSVTVRASDPDGDTLTFSATGLPQTMSIDSSTGVISGNLTEAGGYSVDVTVTDGNGGSDTTTFWWRVTGATSTNAGPKVFWPGDRFDGVGSEISFSVEASDPDGDTLRFSATGLPTGVSIDDATGVISGVVEEASGNSVVITVNDGRGGIDTTPFWWRVTTAE